MFLAVALLPRPAQLIHFHDLSRPLKVPQHANDAALLGRVYSLTGWMWILLQEIYILVVLYFFFLCVCVCLTCRIASVVRSARLAKVTTGRLKYHKRNLDLQIATTVTLPVLAQPAAFRGYCSINWAETR